MKNILILGAGGHGKVVFDCLMEMGKAPAGFADDDSQKWSQNFCGLNVMEMSKALELDPNEWKVANGLGSVSAIKTRKVIYETFKNRGFEFETLIHPSAFVSATATLGEGAQIMAGAVIQAYSTIGENSIVNTKSSVDHDCEIGKNVHIAPGVTLSGNVRLEEGVHFGVGSVAVQGVLIGDWTTIGAGSVVLKNIPEEKVAFGNPATIQNNREAKPSWSGNPQPVKPQI